MTRARELAELATSYDSGNGLGFRNRVINGDMRIDQRNNGASVNYSNNGTFPADRWQTSQNSSPSVSLSIQRSAIAPTGFVNSLLTTVNTGASVSGGTTYNLLVQKIEGNNVADLAWGTASAQTVTLSFWVRSSLTGSFGASIHNSAYNRFYGALFTINAANTWEYKTITIPGDTTGTWLTDSGIGLRVVFDMGCSTNNVASPGSWIASGADGVTGATRVAETTGATFYITGVQLEAGTVATPFERRDYGRELMMCQRYYCHSFPDGTAPYKPATATAMLGDVNAYSVDSLENNGKFTITFPVAMRAVPTVTLSGFTGAVASWACQGTAVGGAATFFQGNPDGISPQKFRIASSISPRQYNLMGHWVASAEL